MKLVVSSPPHWRVKLRESNIHRDFIIALLPALIFAVYTYGMFAVRVISLAAAAALLSDVLIRKLFRKPATFTDGSALLIGLLFGLLMPPGVPYWVVIIGAFLCIFIGKEIFGGLGSSPLNPVLVGWTIIAISWPAYVNFSLSTAHYNLGLDFQYPLIMLKNGGAGFVSDFRLIDLLLGKQVGGMGAAAVLFLLAGGLYLLLRRVVTWEIPLSFAAGVLIMSGIFWAANSEVYANPLFHLLTGNVMIGIFFLSTDYSSSPFNKWSMVAFGLGCGFLTVIFRAWGIEPDGVIFAILIMNLFTPLLDKLKKQPRPLQVSYMEKR
ncbi:MAG: RnfABCDGE type electron transport complex subunit D [Candidatus Aminicenantes bacterium]|nr:RnfABCDGE type electron transport complex subunit D [Candidatus Aminicenantes bacterium]